MIFFVCNGMRLNNAERIAFERLKEIFLEAGFSCSYNEVSGLSYVDDSRFSILKNIFKINKKDLLVVPTFKSAIFTWILKLFTGARIIYWVQGDISEEVYMRTSSKLKKIIIEKLELLALSMSDFHIYVSDEMKKVYKDKIIRRSIVIPCVSTLKYNGIEKEENSYCYVGGLSEWQKVDWMLVYIQKLTRKDSKVKFYFATKELTLAKKLVKSYDLCKFTTIRSLNDSDEISTFLSDKKYGFLFRENSPVNKVSSPIKLAEYLSCGVSVLISPAVASYAKLIENNGCGKIVYSHEETF